MDGVVFTAVASVLAAALLIRKVRSPKPLHAQVGGHRFEENRIGMLARDAFVYKPFQTDAKGGREVEAYRLLRDSPQYERLRPFFAEFHGTRRVRFPDAVARNCIVLDNVCAGMREPCVLDLKVDLRPCDPASSEAALRRAALYRTCGPTGLRIAGMRVWRRAYGSEQHFDRTFGRRVSRARLPAALTLFADPGHLRLRADVLRAAAARVAALRATVSAVPLPFRVGSFSLLVAYDGDAPHTSAASPLKHDAVAGPAALAAVARAGATAAAAAAAARAAAGAGDVGSDAAVCSVGAASAVASAVARADSAADARRALAAEPAALAAAPHPQLSPRSPRGRSAGTEATACPVSPGDPVAARRSPRRSGSRTPRARAEAAAAARAAASAADRGRAEAGAETEAPVGVHVIDLAHTSEHPEGCGGRQESLLRALDEATATLEEAASMAEAENEAVAALVWAGTRAVAGRPREDS